MQAEAESVEHIMRLIREGLAVWVSSMVLNLEVSRNPEPDRRRDAEALLSFANLAVAEQAAADVFLTTDDGILHRAQRSPALLRLRVENPVSWYRELQHASHP